MLVLLFRILSFLPLPFLHGIGVVLGWLVYGLSPRYRQCLRMNICAAGYQTHLRAAIGEAGKGIMELAFVWCAPLTRVQKVCRVENLDLLQQALAAKQGVIFLTPHLGCFELTAQAIAAYARLTVMYRPPRKAALKPLVENARARLENLHLAPATLAGVRILARELKNGQMIGVLPDQTPQQGEGVWAPFFGRQAYTMTLPGKLQQMSGAKLVLTFAERLPFGRGFVVRFELFDAVLGTDPAQQAAAINRAMEKLIANCPAQYFWSYNRYKTPPGVAVPDSV